MKLITVFMAVVLVAGCASRSQERADYEWKGSITIPVPTAEGRIVPTPVPFKLVGKSETEKVEKTGADTDAIAEVVRTTIMAAMNSSGTPWGTILGGAGALATAATTGYLALAKREQMKKAKG